MRRFILFIFLWCTSWALIAQAKNFIQVEEAQLYKNNQPYYFIGANFWQAVHLAMQDKEQLKRELDHLQGLGVNNLRIMLGFEGPVDAPWRVQPALQNEPKKYNEDFFEAIDYLLVELSERQMTAVLVLTNFFQWSGGMAQYVAWAEQKEIPYPHEEAHTWDDFQRFSAQFYANKKANRYYRKFIRTLIKRKNSLTNIRYKDDPTIMAWQLANEPRGFGEKEAYIKWVNKTAKYIQRKDKNHLVSLGGEGKTPSNYAGTHFEEVSQSPYLDYLTVHIWVENWSWYLPKEPETFQPALEKALTYLNDHIQIAAHLDKPIVLEEFGLSRDAGSYDPQSKTQLRDQYYNAFFEQIHEQAKQRSVLMGCNLWSWSGEEQPPTPGHFWKKGDPLIGDPPHELQGWYSVYSKDESTLKLIKKYNSVLKELQTTPLGISSN